MNISNLGRGCILALLPLLLSLPGCGTQQVATSDVQQATALITQTFEDWKRGESLDDQRQKSPPVYVAEEIWLNGSALKEFKIDEPGECLEPMFVSKFH